VTSALLRQARLWTLAAAAGLSLVLAKAVSPRYGLGVLLTAVWATAGFWLLEGLARRALVPPGSPRSGGTIALLAAGKIVLYGVAVWVLMAGIFPPVSHLIGFSLLLAVLVAVSALARGRFRAGRPPTRGDDA